MEWNLLGHEWAVELLRGQLAGGSLRHAYLFTGPQGVGRRTLALRFAQAINCPQPPAPGTPCGVCRTCRQLETQQHPDLAVLAAEEIGGVLKVDQIRELQHNLSLAPYAAAYRIALLLRFEEAHLSAANALLKTLEEPSARVVLLLTADSPENLPETILSRCQLLRLRPLPAGELAAAMQAAWGAPEAEARQIAHLAGGRPGVARRLLDQPELLVQHREQLDTQVRLLSESRAARFAFADQASKDKVGLRELLDVWATYWRDVMIASAGAGAPLTNIDRENEIRGIGERLSVSRAQQALLAVETTRDRIDRNANVRLALETLMLDLPRL